jgi:predicted  nucleic acid-binding Zn-ribbon protein
LCNFSTFFAIAKKRVSREATDLWVRCRELEQEICRQEVHLSKLHSQIAQEESASDKTVQEQLCEELWALQRYVTSLKRQAKKLKLERQSVEAAQVGRVKELKEAREAREAKVAKL